MRLKERTSSNSSRRLLACQRGGLPGYNGRGRPEAAVSSRHLMPKGTTARARRRGQAVSDDVFIPDKLYFRIGEVSRLTRTKAYVLRYWETEFPTLRPGKSSTGHRLYRRRDVEIVLEIRRLLYTQGFTIDGARKLLAAQSARDKSGQKHLFQGTAGAASGLDAPRLREIRRELQGILSMLSRKLR
jgi:DNA-binding transcriptional MerR regulator